MTGDKVYIYGKHAVTEALTHSPHALERVFVVDKKAHQDIEHLTTKAGVGLSAVSPTSLPKGVDPEAVHQGLIGLLSIKRLVKPYADFIKNLEVTPGTALVLLDEIQDPHNVGAIIRSAAAFGAAGVLLPEHNQAPISGAVVKVSAGMAFKLPLIQIGNVNNTIRDLKGRGFWVYGLSETATRPLEAEQFDAPALFVLGNESHGIRQKTLEHCDLPLRIKLDPRCDSLNVAAAAAITLHTWRLQQKP